MLKNSQQLRLRAGRDGNHDGRAEPSGAGVRIIRIVHDWRAAGAEDDFWNPAGLGALTCSKGLLNFEVSPVVASCGHRRVVL
jgi:hypothetical protein